MNTGVKMFAIVLAFAGVMFWAASESMLRAATAIGSHHTQMHDIGQQHNRSQ